MHLQSGAYSILFNTQFGTETRSDKPPLLSVTATVGKKEPMVSRNAIDVRVVKLKSCPNSEMRKHPCLQTLCDPCFFKKFPIDDNKDSSMEDQQGCTRSSRERMFQWSTASMAKKAYSNNKHVFCHNKREGYKDEDISMIVGKWADKYRAEKTDNYLPTNNIEAYQA